MSKERSVNLGSLIGPVTERLAQKEIRREALLLRGTIVGLLVSLGSTVGTPIAVYRTSGNEWSAFLAFSASLAALASTAAVTIPIDNWIKNGINRLSPSDRRRYAEEIQRFQGRSNGPDINDGNPTSPKPPEPPSFPGASSLVPSPIKPAPGELGAQVSREIISTVAK